MTRRLPEGDVVDRLQSSWFPATLAVRQKDIETALARRHLTAGTLVLYDVTSSYMEGRCCPLAQFGYNRDGRRRRRGRDATLSVARSSYDQIDNLDELGILVDLRDEGLQRTGVADHEG